MADTKVSALPATTTLVDADEFYVNDGGVSSKITAANVGVYMAAELASTFQGLDADLTALAGAGNSGVLAATTASFTTADETKLDGIEAAADVTDATNVAAAGAVMVTTANAKGDLFAATADNTVTRLGVGANGHVLTADSAEATGLKWAAGSGGSTVYPIPRLTGVYRNSIAASGLTTSGVQNAIGFQHFYVPAAGTLNGIIVEVTTAAASGLIRLGVYSITSYDNPNNGLTLVADFGTIDASTTGFKEATGSAAVSPGWYMLAGACSNHAVSARAVFSASGQGSVAGQLLGFGDITQGRQIAGWRTGSIDYSAGLPATITPSMINGGSTAVIHLSAKVTYT